MSAKKKKTLPQNSNHIGIFDSGFGGLTVMNAVRKLLPHENIIYFGDTGHVPYGSKSKEVVTRLSKNIADFLIARKVKIIVIACNTASAFALGTLQKTYTTPVLGVIEPGAAAAVAASVNKKIGVIGTQGTISSASYPKAIAKISKKIGVIQTPCPLFVPIVEEGWTQSAIAKQVAALYLKNLVERKIDTLVLGCTHYPLLKNTIKSVTGKNIKLIDSAAATAIAVKQMLMQKNLLNKSKARGKYTFFVSDNPKKFAETGSIFFGKKIKKVSKINLSGVRSAK
jgi:glutamate racemase